MRLLDVTCGRCESGCELRGAIKLDSASGDGESTFDVWFRVSEANADAFDPTVGDAFVAAMLLPAMATGEPIEIELPVSARMLDALDQVQELYRFWDPTLNPIAVRGPRLSTFEQGGDRRGAFFSCGVDSTYTLLKNVQRHANDAQSIDTLILIHGFDIFVDKLNRDLYPKALENARRVATHHGKNLFEVATNLRDVTDRFVHWGSIGYGSNLASIALALQGTFRRVVIAASNTYAHLGPLGAHPVLDPLWSTERLAIAHDGCEASRLEKLALVAQDDAALGSLRVCASLTPTVNCGKCDKCLLTMIGLEVCGALDRCPTLPHRIDPASVDAIHVASLSRQRFIREIVGALQSRGIREDVRVALERRLAAADTGGVVRAADDRRWMQSLRALDDVIRRVVPPGDAFVIIDDGQFYGIVGEGRRPVPFVNRDGQYWGPPADSEAAIAEWIATYENESPTRLVVAFNATWWLDHYDGFASFLRESFAVVTDDAAAMVFDLTAPAHAEAPPETTN